MREAHRKKEQQCELYLSARPVRNPVSRALPFIEHDLERFILRCFDKNIIFY